MEALTVGNNGPAISIFTDGLSLFPKPTPSRLSDATQINLLHGLAVARLRSGEVPPAKLILDQLRSATKTNRSILFNDALLDTQSRDTISRSIGTLERALNAGPTDESLVNLYGYAVSQAEAVPALRSRIPTLWQNYQRFEKQLPPPSSTQHHWGSKWIGDAEYQAIMDEKMQSTAHRTELTQRIATIQNDAATTQQNIETLQANIDIAKQRSAKVATVNGLQKQLTQAQDKLRSLESQMTSATTELQTLSDGPKPTFDKPEWKDPVLELQTKQ